MVTLAQALKWDAASLSRVGRSLQVNGHALDDAADGVLGVLGSIGTDSFDGANRVSAEGAASESAAELRRGSMALGRIADSCGEASVKLGAAVTELREAVAEAERLGLSVDPVDGHVGEGPSALGRGRTQAQAADRALMLRLVESCQRRVSAALSRVREIDQIYGGAIAAFVPFDSRAPGARMRSLPEASEVSGEGGGDGEGDSAESLPLSPAMADAARALGLPAARVLESSPGHSAIAFGNVDTAKTVITLVPGTGSSAAQAHDQLSRVSAMFDASGRPREDVAVVLFPYDAPPALTEAAKADYHDRAAERLQHLQSELSARGRPHEQVVAGYSYGATVAAQSTLGRGLYADRVLLIASPGVGPGLRSAEQMKLLRSDGTSHESKENSHRVAVATSPADPIRIAADAGVHGIDPSDDDFGAHRMDLNRPWYESAQTLSEFAVRPRLEPLFRAHTTHYFDDEIFTRETRRWLRQPT